jgi:hypothetical protein
MNQAWKLVSALLVTDLCASNNRMLIKIGYCNILHFILSIEHKLGALSYTTQIG